MNPKTQRLMRRCLIWGAFCLLMNAVFIFYCNLKLGSSTAVCIVDILAYGLFPAVALTWLLIFDKDEKIGKKIGKKKGPDSGGRPDQRV